MQFRQLSTTETARDCGTMSGLNRQRLSDGNGKALNRWMLLEQILQQPLHQLNFYNT